MPGSCGGCGGAVRDAVGAGADTRVSFGFGVGAGSRNGSDSRFKYDAGSDFKFHADSGFGAFSRSIFAAGHFDFGSWAEAWARAKVSALGIVRRVLVWTDGVFQLRTLGPLERMGRLVRAERRELAGAGG